MKDVIIQVPKIEPKLTVYEKIKKAVGNDTLTPEQILAKTKDIDLYNLRSKISNLVVIGDLESISCPHCNVGKMYRRKNVS